MMVLLLVAGAVLALLLVAAAVVAVGLAARGARAHRHGQERSDLAGAPERMQHRDLPDLPTRRISREDLP